MVYKKSKLFNLFVTEYVEKQNNKTVLYKLNIYVK